MSSINLIKKIDKTVMLWNGITILINYFLFPYILKRRLFLWFSAAIIQQAW